MGPIVLEDGSGRSGVPLPEAWKSARPSRKWKVLPPPPSPRALARLRRHTLTIGVEVEAYTISVPEFYIGRRTDYPSPSLVEKGEAFVYDKSIGIEYNAKPCQTVREMYFALKTGLRKFHRRLYRTHEPGEEFLSVFLAGGWRDRFAGSHLHLGVEDGSLRHSEANALAQHLHDQIPFVVAILANSPVWRDRLSSLSDNRLLRCTDEYCLILPRGRLSSYHYHEMNANGPTKRKPLTVELRVGDSNLPEFLCAALTVMKAVAIRAVDGFPPANLLSHAQYVRSRLSAARRGATSRLYWRGRSIPFSEYVDRFLDAHADALGQMEVPDEVVETFRLLKRGIDGATLQRRAVLSLRRRFPRAWQRKFAQRYVGAIEKLLGGETLTVFARELGVRLPSTRRTGLGRRREWKGRSSGG
jgi:hypothetical protein